jgi:transcription initiation factor IIE alpha subunit
MKRVISREDAKNIVSLLKERQPRTFDDFKDALGAREFELRKLLKSLESAKVIIRESLSGEEKFWLNTAQGVDFLGRDQKQRKRLKHPKKRLKREEVEPDNPIYR